MVLSPTATRQLVLEATREAQRRIQHGIYEPFGSCAQLQKINDPELVISGPAGTGKSRACLEKIHRLASDVPGSRYLIVRKTRASLTESALQTYETWVLGDDHPMLYEGPRRQFRHNYSYPNGSEIIIGGLDKPSRIMSTEFDLIFVQEAIELEEDDWDALGTRLRNNVLPFQQLLADTNPSFPKHWLYVRCQTTATRMLQSTHKDNPRLWDHEREDWTAEGTAYIDRLNRLTGVRLSRFRYGLWEADDPRALWNREMFDHVPTYPDLYRIGVAIDPAASSGQTGILAGGVARVKGKIHGYLLEDATPERGAEPHDWGTEAIASYNRLHADVIIAEVNHGGKMVKDVIRNVEGGSKVGYTEVRASRGKNVRAEPITTLYTEGRIHHVGTFNDTEDELCNWVPGESTWSPNRMDALVWLFTKLILEAEGGPLPDKQPEQQSRFTSHDATQGSRFKRW